MHPVLQVRLQQCRAERDNPFPHPAGNVVLNTPQGTVVLPGCLGTLLTHAQFAVDQDPQPLSVGLLSSVPSPSQCVCPGLPLPRCRIRPLFLLYLMQLVLAQFSNLSTCLCKASPPPVVATAPPCSISSANKLKTPFAHACRSLMKTSKRSGPQMEPWGALLVTIRQLDGALLVYAFGPHPLAKCSLTTLCFCLTLCRTFCPEVFSEEQYQKLY